MIHGKETASFIEIIVSLCSRIRNGHCGRVQLRAHQREDQSHTTGSVTPPDKAIASNGCEKESKRKKTGALIELAFDEQRDTTSYMVSQNLLLAVGVNLQTDYSIKCHFECEHIIMSYELRFHMQRSSWLCIFSVSNNENLGRFVCRFFSKKRQLRNAVCLSQR